MNAARTATWYFDFVSPFAYLQQEQRPVAGRRRVRAAAHRARRTTRPLGPSAGRDRGETRLHLSPRAISRGQARHCIPDAARAPVQSGSPLRLAIAMGNSPTRSGGSSGISGATAGRVDAGRLRRAVRSGRFSGRRDGRRRPAGGTRCAQTPTTRSRTAYSACRPSHSTATCSGARMRPTCSPTARRRARGSIRPRCAASARCPKDPARLKPLRPPAALRLRHIPRRRSVVAPFDGRPARIIAANRTSRDG